MTKIFQPNNSESLKKSNKEIKWVKKNTAILIVHGIGNQLPLETLDQFGRGLVAQFKNAMAGELILSHEIVAKNSDDDMWFDNVLRIKITGCDNYIDLYEYYWANYTQDKASWSDLNDWLQGVVNGADHFYKRNAQMGQQYKDSSIFFNKKTGKFNKWMYKFFLATVSRVFMAVNFTVAFLLKVLSGIPLLGSTASALLKKLYDTGIHDLTNVIGDIVVYNVTDPKSKFYDVKRRILDGAVKAVRYLIEQPEDENLIGGLQDDLEKGRIKIDDFARRLKNQNLKYTSVVIAGHSLGTQIAYDAINKINLLVNEGDIKCYNKDGTGKFRNCEHISRQLNGFITFGSPLDKIVFFLRENVPDEEYLRQQFLDHYHGFKQQNIDKFNNADSNKPYTKVACELKKNLENVKWRNYYDNKDYVSGSLDYYSKLVNINCDFKAGTFGFTHSYYWSSHEFFEDIIHNFLI